MPDDQDTNNKIVVHEELSAVEPVARRIVARHEASGTVKTWTWKKYFEIGLDYAGITLWKWNIRTGNLELASGSAKTSRSHGFPSSTTWKKIVHADDQERLLEALTRFEHTSYTALDCVFRLAADGSPRWVHARDMHLYLNANGEPDYVVGLFFDVTDSQVAKEEMFWGREFPQRGNEDKIHLLRLLSERQRHQKDSNAISGLMDQCYHEFMSLFSFSNLPAFRKNVDLANVEVNPAMEQLLGIPSEEILKRTDEEIWGDEASARIRRLCGYVLRGETVLVYSTRNIKGVQMEFLDQFYPDWGPNRSIIGICGIMAPKPADFIPDVKTPRQRERTSFVMQDVYLKVQLAAQYDTNILLTGESGCGKDFFARQIHDLSKRGTGPFENLNCAALQKELAGSELFGHEAGAFTGAKNRRKGIFELAENGTVFLNEIGDMPLDLQPKLLTVLETRLFRRVGGEKNVALNARIIAATNRDLNKDVEQGLFRKDLYHRLSVFAIRIPPLRERLEELPSITENLLSRISTEMGLEEIPAVDPSTVRKLRTHDWPGNIRELGNVLERAIMHSHGSAIGTDHIVFETQSHENALTTLSDKIQSGESTSKPGSGKYSAQKPKRGPRKLSQDQIRGLYREYIVEKNWSRAQLAAHWAVDSSTLKKWFKEAGLPAGQAGRPKKKRVD